MRGSLPPKACVPPLDIDASGWLQPNLRHRAEARAEQTGVPMVVVGDRDSGAYLAKTAWARILDSPNLSGGSRPATTLK